jgi:hypothetical protein
LYVTTGKIAGMIHFQCDPDIAWSPYQAPFASLYLIDNIQFEIIRNFIKLMVLHLKDRGISFIYLKHYPDFYSIQPPDKLITAFLFEGFQIKQTDINHYLEVNDYPFDSMIHTMHKRRIRKCMKLGYKFSCRSNNELEIVFRKIRDFRMQKKIPLNIEWKTLKQLVRLFPDRYQLFTIEDRDKIIAATCTVSVNKNTLYYFLPASDEKYKNSSPMVYLIKNLYEYAQTFRYRYIDLGVSSIKNQPQSGLITFKENLGGITGIKFLLEKTIEKADA